MAQFHIRIGVFIATNLFWIIIIAIILLFSSLLYSLWDYWVVWKKNKLIQKENKKNKNIPPKALEKSKIWGILSGMIGWSVILAFLSFLVTTQSAKEQFGRYHLALPISLEEQSPYIERKVIEERIGKHVGNLKSHEYIFIIGENGCGKSTLMNHIINGKSGIVKIGVSGRTTVDGLSKSLLESIDVPLEAWNEGTEVAIFGKICEAVHDGMWTPTVVFDVEGNVRKEVLQELVKTAKRLTSDEN
jgi:hypothetical protein